ncbi:ankyrin [Trametes gibbosa]|nr:ankyrin [Trametes gibbosa]
MPQTPEAEAFLARVAGLPRSPAAHDALSKVLEQSLEDEAELRKLFATDKGNIRLQDPHVGLVDLFDAPDDIRATCMRVVTDGDDLSTHYVLPLSETQRRKDGEPAMVSGLDEFKKNWAIFSEGALSQLTDWSNVVVAGGSIQACLTPIPDTAKASKRAMRKYFHGSAFPASDIDLFMYGMTPEQAEAKMQVVYEAVRNSVPWDVTCIRTKHTVSIHSQYPYRSVQIVLRLYSSPAEILAGFDVDAPCCLYDGERVWANPRAIVAMMRQCNTVDVTRRSPSYEVRLAKYSARGFEVHVPTLRRGDIDPTIFERSIARVQGLARLLVLERLVDPDAKVRYLSERRVLRARPPARNGRGSRRKRKVKGDLKANTDFGGLEMNDYDVQSLHIPYGPGWDARRIDKLVYQTDLGMNSPYNPKNKRRRLHRHPAFFGTMTECLEDCCEARFCIEPKDDEEKKLQETEDKSYVRGRIQFIREDPGRQSISGSFHPIDDGEWAGQAYIGPTEKLFKAIVAGDRASVAKIIAGENNDVDRRDHVGRTPLHVAILAKEVDIAGDLIDAGARMTSRLVDGRTALHLAAQLDLPVVVRKLLERSAINAEKAKEEGLAKSSKKDLHRDVDLEDGKKMEVDEEKEDDEDNGARNSSEDDWSSDDEGKSKEALNAPKPDASLIPEDDKDVPDVIDVNMPDWDFAFTPLHYAVAFGSVAAVDELLVSGADAKLATKADRYTAPPWHVLTATALTRDVDAACNIAKKLFAHGAVSSEADDNLFTILHKIVCAGRPALVETFLRYDPKAKTVLNSPYVTAYQCEATFPIVSAIAKGHHAALAVLLAYGAKVVFAEKDYDRARELRKNAWARRDGDWRAMVYLPVETAIAHLDDVVQLLFDIGAEFNIDVKGSQNDRSNPNLHRTILDYIRIIIPALQNETDDMYARIDERSQRGRYREVTALPGWQGERGAYLLKVSEKSYGFENDTEECAEKRVKYFNSIAYLRKVEELLVAHDAKSAKELFGPNAKVDTSFQGGFYGRSGRNYPSVISYQKMKDEAKFEDVPSHLTALYDELFEACRVGDSENIQALCRPKGKIKGKGLQVTCTFLNDKGIDIMTSAGLSPLSMAINNRQWDAARLILAIAVAQYKPKETKLVSSDLALEGDESDGVSECDPDAMSVENAGAQVTFVDIAQQSSHVETDVPPKRLLELSDIYLCPNWTEGPPLFKAVMEDDFEAFVQICDLYKSLLESSASDPPAHAVAWICEYDRPMMLEELIRRAGVGIAVPESHELEEDSGDDPHRQSRPKPSAKTYFGLNVHGKKRKDLAQKGDPNAPGSAKTFEFPLLWTAIRKGASAVVKYLATGRPVAAYDYYVSTNSGDRAKYLSRIREEIPARLGWTSNELNESAVTAAVIASDVDLLKALVGLQPTKLQSALVSHIHYVGFNNILVAANWGSSAEMFDYLVSQGVSPTESDVRGWNVYHLLCAHSASEKHLKLLKHILNKLPLDVTQHMLLQQSKDALNTPLHIAVKRASVPAVRLILQIEAPMFTLRDKFGSTAFHVAVKDGHPEIARHVGDAAPVAVLYLEDGVGNTPLEIATQMWLQRATWTDVDTSIPAVEECAQALYEYEWAGMRVRSASMAEAKLLKDTVDGLLANGQLRSGHRLTSALVAFSEGLMDKAEKEESDRSVVVEEEPTDHAPLLEPRNIMKTLEYVVGAVSARTARRGLVHLDDVHRSVKASLIRSHHDELSRKADDGGLNAEVVEDAHSNIKIRSALAQWHDGSVMSLFDADPW